jgi:hypothetical protein
LLLGTGAVGFVNSWLNWIAWAAPAAANPKSMAETATTTGRDIFRAFIARAAKPNVPAPKAAPPSPKFFPCGLSQKLPANPNPTPNAAVVPVTAAPGVNHLCEAEEGDPEWHALNPENPTFASPVRALLHSA